MRTVIHLKWRPKGFFPMIKVYFSYFYVWITILRGIQWKFLIIYNGSNTKNHLFSFLRLFTNCAYSTKILEVLNLQGVPGWLSQLSIQLPLRSCSQGSWFQGPHQAPCWAWSLESGAWFRFCVSLSLSLPLHFLGFVCVSLSLKNKYFF